MRWLLACSLVVLAGCMSSAAEPTQTTDALAPDVAPAWADEDGDGVHDSMDRCPGYDDRDDYDQDGVPDACDASAYTGPKPDPWEDCERGPRFVHQDGVVEPTYWCGSPPSGTPTSTLQGEIHLQTCMAYWTLPGLTFSCRSVDNYEQRPPL